MSEKKEISRGDAIYHGGMLGVWLAIAIFGVVKVGQDGTAGEAIWIGFMVIVIAAFWISRKVVTLVDYAKQN